jgi:hypothetical protein
MDIKDITWNNENTNVGELVQLSSITLSISSTYLSGVHCVGCMHFQNLIVGVGQNS